MYRTQVIILGLLAVFAASTAASASASAAPQFSVCSKVSSGKGKFKDHLCVTEGGEKEWEYETLSGAETFEVEGTVGLSFLEGTIAGVQTFIECKKYSFRGSIDPGGKSKGTNELTECQLAAINSTRHLEPLGACSVSPAIFNTVSHLRAGHGQGPEEEFKPENEGTKFFEVKITGSSCLLKGTSNTEVVEKGQGMTCSLPMAIFSEVRHEVVCISTGDEHLRFAGKPASFYSVNDINLQNGWYWYAE